MDSSNSYSPSPNQTRHGTLQYYSMDSNSPSPTQTPTNHIINMVTIDNNRLAAIQQKINTPPKILSKAAGRATCSIFKVPKSFNDVNGKLYQPQIISIGPFHHDQQNVQMMEEHKYHYLGQLLTRTKLALPALFNAVAPLVGTARECYSEVITFEDQHLLEMLVVDGCFIIELFRKVSKLVMFEEDDPIASMSWIFPALLRDLHLLENQIPFFFLQSLYDFTCDDKQQIGDFTLATLSLGFFNFTIQRPEKIISKFKDLKPKHLLDLLRSSFITRELDPEDPSKENSAPQHVIHSVSKLRQAGIHLRPGKSETFLAVKFKRGVIEMPKVTMDDFMSSLLANCVTYEQCHNGHSTYFTTYATFLDSLVNSAKDVEYLCDKNILENYFGTEAEIATFINNLGKDVAFDIDQCYLANLFNDINTYHQNDCHVYWATLKYTYFNTPWSFISVVAAFVLLFLTILQTLYTVYPYYKPGN
ncbi:hypothetical protein SOVF_068360 [Spinacia oleracea]|uniref:UPF0481 protein At3g47200 n=1 Tax=Spinacia oleracea TaxID=3562 RepID=A0A9R0IDF4_SPIOL|nr:UPF0481 protein At3g47200 [Spinacia oleracea]KNA18694.1 hypothetical protein SOVF_068360 [Spinacia oleracea]